MLESLYTGISQYEMILACLVKTFSLESLYFVGLFDPFQADESMNMQNKQKWHCFIHALSCFDLEC